MTRYLLALALCAALAACSSAPTAPAPIVKPLLSNPCERVTDSTCAVPTPPKP